MGNFQYKSTSTGSWTDVPTTAYHGTFMGSFDVVYPEAQDRDGNGLPCGAVGPRHIKLRSEIMTASGLHFWQNFFSNEYATSREFWLTAKNPRTNLWSRYTGWLLRPTYERVQIGSGSMSTLYSGVDITIDLLSNAT